MNTTAAATQAGVTVATIRAWCRHGVVAAVKQAGRWIIDQASLAARIAIGQMRTRKAAAMDLTATYTFTRAGDTQPTTVTPKIRTRERDGVQITTVRTFAALLADRIDAITDDARRLHTLETLLGASIAIRSEADMTDEQGTDQFTTYREYGRLSTSYEGTADLPVETVLDLAARIRAAL